MQQDVAKCCHILFIHLTHHIFLSSRGLIGRYAHSEAHTVSPTIFLTHAAHSELAC